MLGRDGARRVIAEYGTNDLDRIVKGERLDLVVLPRWNARFDDCFVWPVLLLPDGITNAYKRTLIAHSLGHHFLHDGNQIWMRGFDQVWNRKMERQAEEFAAFLTIPEMEEAYLTGLPGSEVAKIYRVEEDLVRIRRS